MEISSSTAVTLVVVSYNSAALLPDFFASLPAALDGIPLVEVVVADNASTDDSVAVARRLRPEATIVALPENRGYAAGINAAVAAARRSDAILILNDDIRLGPGSVRRLFKALAPPEVAITVPRLVDGEGRLLKSLKREPHIVRTLGEALIGGDRSGRHRWLGEVVQDEGDYERPTEAAWASGCAWLISRECWEAVGRWDESFFLYAEETEYALRSRDAGYRLRLVPAADAVHLVGPSHDNPRLWAMTVWNKYRLYRRRHGRVESAAFWAALFLNELLRAAAGRRVHRAGLLALVFESRRPVEVR